MPDTQQHSTEPAWVARRDAAYLLTVVIAGTALIGAILAVGLSARAVNGSKRSIKVLALPVATRVSSAVGAADGLRITERDLTIDGPVAPVRAGPFNLVVTNTGPSPHELLIFRTDLAQDRLPVANGVVDEASSQMIKVFDTGSNVDPGATRSFLLTLPAGSYVLVCNLPGHYLAGMHTVLKVI